ncbi:MAG: prolyl oligopeptidase family serine peptidase [Candidatus Krumholzibacteria bacterium]|nr:prolyl oligopeptidase family serine peptidase [Candidatus Krumholzibacteria bacterium]
MKHLIVFLILFLTTTALNSPTTARSDHEWETIELRPCPNVLEEKVTFLETPPEIDGVLDKRLGVLPVREFNYLIKSDAGNPIPTVTYRLAYGVSFFYVYIEASADSMVYNDRAYQNGDGFHMVLAKPQPNQGPTEEFYVLACSAVKERRMEWTRRIFWYYNVDNIFIPTSDDATHEFHDGEGTIGFELLLPWNDVYPYHPWLSDGVGFNLAFVKAFGEGKRNSYKVKNATLGAENKPREYALLDFQEPALESGTQSYVIPKRNHIQLGDTLHARAVTLSASPGREALRVRIKSGEGATVRYHRVDYDCDAGLTPHDFTLESFTLPYGGYQVTWYSRENDSEGETGLTILPKFDAATLTDRIEGTKKNLSEGSYHTMRFLVREVEEDLQTVKPYETCARQRLQIMRLLDYIERSRQGNDYFASATRFVRRAYLSEIDNTLQPYVVWVPPDFDPNRTYPLIVFLHGSASTERNIMGFQRLIPDDCIALGPKGRGPSNAWSWDHAQDDVAEAIDAVVTGYPIDTDRIVLTGFSMGGYGVYRTFYETPEKFKALVVMSGHPDIANAYSGESGHPNFNQSEYLMPFNEVPMFIFHGKKDLNVSFEDTEKLIDKLRQAGAKVEVQFDEERGHEAPSEETISAYRRWLDEVLRE